MLVYLRLASHYNIIDKPNERSSHSNLTIRGGGIIFVLAVLLWYFIEGFQYSLFMAGFLIISAVSFIDDLGHVPNQLRITTHLVTVILLLFEVMNSSSVFPDTTFWQSLIDAMVGVSTSQPASNTAAFLGVFTSNNASTYLSFLIALPIVMGFLNAYNFMDGINGITVVNALVTLGTLFYLNIDIHFMDPDLLLYVGMGLLIFGFFNFRRKAACFAGDVGAVSMAFLITFALTLLIVATGNYYFIALVLVYGVDSVGTIIERLIKRENIFQAHRSHLYQLMANQSSMPHLLVSTIYGAVQLLVNLVLIFAINQGYPLFWVFSLLFFLLVGIFAFAKLKIYRVFSLLAKSPTPNT